MTTTLGIVEIPCLIESPGGRLDSSLATRRFGNKTLVEWVVRRVTESLLLDQVAIVADAGHREILERLAPPDVSLFLGTQADSLGRVAAAVRHFGADQVVRVPVACPFVDPELIDRLVCAASANPGFDYIGYFSIDGRPAVLSKVGLFAEWCSKDALRRAEFEATSPADRGHPTRYIYSHPESFQLRFIPIPEKLDRRDVRLTIEAEEDWDHAHVIFEALGPEGLDWRRIVALLDHQPALRQRMAILNDAARP